MKKIIITLISILSFIGINSNVNAALSMQDVLNDLSQSSNYSNTQDFVKTENVISVKDKDRIVYNTFSISSNEKWITYGIEKDKFTRNQYIKNIETGKVYFLAKNIGKNPNFSPDSKNFVFIDNGFIKILNLETLKIRSLNSTKIKGYDIDSMLGNIVFIKNDTFIIGSINKYILLDILFNYKVINIEGLSSNVSYSNGYLISGDGKVNINLKNTMNDFRSYFTNNKNYLISVIVNQNTKVKIYNFNTKKEEYLGVSFINGIIINNDIIYFVKNNGSINTYNINTKKEKTITKENEAMIDRYNTIKQYGNNIYYISMDGKKLNKISIK